MLQGGTVVDMSRLNRILSIDTQNKTILVQAGVTWEQIQESVNPNGLAVAVMQSSNIFTVGGSLSVNAHGRDPRFGPMIDSVKRIKMLLSDGSIRWVSRDQDGELFHLAIGGY
ncbi:MAG: FAD-binding oxidoreductase, partial [Parachlamydia sp.]|nr:FAD-binding oxidoreductase [Parachlamydia sp.]